ncbi:MAG: IS200/IS605 family transposase [Dehalococcoidales bacterium]|nr:IS200/IS605 family transposase [Dehalococcoidales bacterium]
MEIRLSGHTAYQTEYHIVWIPKYRYHVLNPGVKAYLVKLFPKVMEELPGCEIVKYNIQTDHIHMVIIIPPKYPVSTVVGKIKGMTSSALRKKFGWMKLRYSRENVVWSPGYFVSTIGVERERILKYVEYQQRQDSGQAKLEI